MIERVVGNYRIVELLGEGGMGTVYKAVDLMLEREVAIKAIRPELTREAEIVERFRAEAKMLARISHPAIATIYSFFLDGGDLFLAMEFVRGVSLSRLLQRDGPMPWEQAVPLLAGALDGIEQAHRAGIVHRDLKPDNLMITASGAVKVMDFGIARVIGSGRLTRTGLLIGTLRYMAPEQIRGEEVDRRTDVYALGVVLYEMVTGRVPFDGSSDYAVLKAQIEEIPAPPSVALPALPAWLDQAILKALAKEPDQRFQTVDELRLFLLGQGLPLGAAGPAMVVSVGDQPTLVRAPTPGPVPAAVLPAVLPAPLPAGIAEALAPTTFRPASRPSAAPPSAVAPDGRAAAASSYREVGGAPPGRFSRPLAAAMFLLVVVVAAAAIYRLRIPAVPAPAPLSPPPAPPSISAGAAAAGSAAGAGSLPAGAAAPGTAGAAAPGTAGLSALGPANGAQQSRTSSGGAARADTAGSDGAAAAARSARRKAAAAGGAGGAAGAAGAAGASDDTEGQDQPAVEAAPGTGGDSGSSAADDAERFGGLPAGELRRLAVELQRESEYLRNVYGVALEQKVRAGGHPTDDEERLADELKELQGAAESFSQPFQNGLFARTRARLGRITRGEDERSRVVRLGRALAGSGKKVDDLMRQTMPEGAVHRLWILIRRQTLRVAEICGD
jgi:hypothetical protein